MIYSLTGEIIFLNRCDSCFLLALQCNSGISFELKVSSNTADAVRGLKEVCLYVHMVLRENSIELYGFYNESEKRVFKLLISVSGVGPSFALAILSTFTPYSFLQCLSAGDVDRFCECRGIGPKTAKRIILELKDKVKEYTVEKVAQSGDISSDVANEDIFKEAVEALLVLGYGRNETVKAVYAQKGADSVESIVKAALLMLSGG